MEASGDHSYGTILAFASGHGGSTRSLIMPNSDAQAALACKALKAAKVEPIDVVLLEGKFKPRPIFVRTLVLTTGSYQYSTWNGDAGRGCFRSRRHTLCVPKSRRQSLTIVIIENSFGSLPRLSSARRFVITVFSLFHVLIEQFFNWLGMLKVLSCFEKRVVPAHHIMPHAEFRRGSVIIPVQPATLEAGRLIAQVNAFGFTGSIATIILESMPQPSLSPELSPQAFVGDPSCYYLLPFSGKSATALSAQMHAVSQWAMSSGSSLADIALILGLCRDHYKHRCAILVGTMADLITACSSPPALRDMPSRAMTKPDERLTVDVLNLNEVDPKCFDASFEEQDLKKLEREGRILEAAQILYERGHTLSFSAVYNKREVNAKVLRGFPVYQFDRKQWWKGSITGDAHRLYEVGRSPLRNHLSAGDISFEPHQPPNLAEGQTKVPPVDQEAFESLIAHFGASIDPPCASKDPAVDVRGSHILVTGGNGMLGATLSSRLLQVPSITVYCLVRGDPWDRLHMSFKKHHLDVQLLEEARARGTLRVMRTANICEHRLGLSDEDYDVLVESIDEVVHTAWNVNFNLPLTAFHPFLACTQSLAKLCASAKKLVRYHFVGSYASTFNYDEDLVPERVIKPRLSDSLAQVRTNHISFFLFLRKHTRDMLSPNSLQSTVFFGSITHVLLHSS